MIKDSIMRNMNVKLLAYRTAINSHHTTMEPKYMQYMKLASTLKYVEDNHKELVIKYLSTIDNEQRKEILKAVKPENRQPMAHPNETDAKLKGFFELRGSDLLRTVEGKNKTNLVVSKETDAYQVPSTGQWSYLVVLIASDPSCEKIDTVAVPDGLKNMLNYNLPKTIGTAFDGFVKSSRSIVDKMVT